MGKRGENIRYRKWDRRWEARVVTGTTTEGKTQYKCLYAKSYREVREKKKEYERDHTPREFGEALSSPSAEAAAVRRSSAADAGADRSPSSAGSAAARRFTFREVSESWLVYKKMTIRDSTYVTYRFLIRTHLLPKLGDVPLDRLTAEALEEFLLETRSHGRLRDGGRLSDKTVCDLKVLLEQILTYADTHRMADEVPECPPVSARPPAVRVLSAAEQRKLESAASGAAKPFSLGIFLGLCAGLRDGEICGLRWEDIDFAEGTVTVRRTVSRIQNHDDASGPRTRVGIGAPKTESSRRTIPLTRELARILFPECRGSGIYVVTGTETCTEPRTFRARFKRLLRRAGLADCTVHTLRHTFATRCVESGVDVKTLSEIMGHSDVRTTLQRYVHPSLEAKKVQMDKLSSLLEDGPGKGPAEGGNP